MDEEIFVEAAMTELSVSSDDDDDESQYNDFLSYLGGDNNVKENVAALEVQNTLQQERNISFLPQYELLDDTFHDITTNSSTIPSHDNFIDIEEGLSPDTSVRDTIRTIDYTAATTTTISTTHTHPSSATNNYVSSDNNGGDADEHKTNNGSSQSQVRHYDPFLYSAFHSADTDNNGSLSATELKELLGTLGFVMQDEHHLNAVIQRFDADNKNSIDFEEFMSVFDTLMNNGNGKSSETGTKGEIGLDYLLRETFDMVRACC